MSSKCYIQHRRLLLASHPSREQSPKSATSGLCQMTVSWFGKKQKHTITRSLGSGLPSMAHRKGLYDLANSAIFRYRTWRLLTLYMGISNCIDTGPT